MKNFHASNGKRKPQKSRHRDRGKSQNEPLIEQPIADSIGAVPCAICGHLVDPKRMHPHMVRFHNVAIRSQGNWNKE
jgi:hypothetical protein